MTGAELRAMREAAGIGIRELAVAIGRDRGHLSRVERGDRDPTPAIVAAYKEALAGTLDDMRRRTFLAAGAAVPLAGLMAAAPVRVGASEVAAVRSLALDLDLTHPWALDIAETALHRAAGLLQARVRPEIAPSLAEAVALLADRVGWARFEAGRDAASTLGFAQRTAQRGDDAGLHAHALIDLAVSSRDARVAVATLDHALTGPVAGAERVNVHAVAARRAAGHDPHAAREHLAQALDIEPVAAGSDWAERITSAPGHLDAIVGFAAYAVGHAVARERLTYAVEKLGDRRKRTLARCHTRLAGLALADGDRDAVDQHLGVALGSRRSVSVAGDLRELASRARRLGHPDVARLAARG